MRNDCVVYAHHRPDKNVDFYIGKGRGRRPVEMTHRNEHHKSIVAKLRRNKMEPIVRYIKTNLTDTCAYCIEWILIHAKGKEHLANGATGSGLGGPAGAVRSAEFRANVASKLRGLKRSPEEIEKSASKRRGRPPHPNFRAGHTRYFAELAEKKKSNPVHKPRKSRLLTREERTAIIVASVGRPVECMTDGRKFEASRDAADFYGVSRSRVCDVLRGRLKHTKGLTFRYLEKRG